MKDQRDAMGHPMQPIGLDELGTARFKENKIVRWLLDEAGEGRKVDMNRIAMMGHFGGGLFSKEDQMQFAQLIGYSVCGYGELGYVSDESYFAASAQADALLEDERR
jgi:hypothetical protein